MGDQMMFPETFDDFAEQYKIVDTKEVYTNGTEMIPIFRVRQWLMRPNEPDINAIVHKTKAEAYKEFAERLRDKARVNNLGDGFVYLSDINETEKELVGEQVE